MLRFILRRLAIIPIALLIVNFFAYSYAYLARPMRAARIPYLATSLPPAEPEDLLPTYHDHLNQAIHLDFGAIPGGANQTLRSLWGQHGTISIGGAIAKSSLASLGLLFIALLLSTAIGLTLGLSMARSNPPHVSRWLTIPSTLGLAMPSFYLGSIFVLALFRYKLAGGPSTEMPLPMSGFGWDKHLILPTIALMARPTVQIAQVTASLLVDEFEQQYIVTARSVGHRWRTIRRKHALRNIVASVVLTISGSFRLLMGELILVEWLFGWPGLGTLLAQSLIPSNISAAVGTPLFLDPPVVSAVLTVFAALFLLSDLIASTLVRILDPRLGALEQES